MKYKAVIFDLDGTLIDSLSDIASTMNRVLVEHGFPEHDIEAYRFLVGHGLEELVREALPADRRRENDVDFFLLEFRRVYKKHCLDTTRPFPGINSLLSFLEEKKIPKAVLSNKSDQYTKQLVAELFPDYEFHTVQGTVQGVPLKPEPGAAVSIAGNMHMDPGSVLFVGDSAVDIQTGQNAGMATAAVTWGIRPREELVKYNPTYLVNRPEELENLF